MNLVLKSRMMTLLRAVVLITALAAMVGGAVNAQRVAFDAAQETAADIRNSERIIALSARVDNLEQMKPGERIVALQQKLDSLQTWLMTMCGGISALIGEAIIRMLRTKRGN